MSWAYLDTHVAVWLHAGLVEKLTQEAKREIEKRDLLISPMVYLELDYLQQCGKVRYPPATIFAELSGTFGITICPFSFPAIIIAATGFRWSKDPFDRVIVAHALANKNSSLITADENIRKHYKNSVW